MTSESQIELPFGVSMPLPIQTQDEPAEGDSDADKARQLPDPVGWKLLCVVPDVSDKFDGTTIVKATMSMKAEEHATTVLFVLKVGPDAYKDPSKFHGPWCKAGDFVLVRNYTGTRFKIYGKEFRVINDDQVEAVVQDPRGITRVGM